MADSIYEAEHLVRKMREGKTDPTAIAVAAAAILPDLIQTARRRHDSFYEAVATVVETGRPFKLMSVEGVTIMAFPEQPGEIVGAVVEEPDK